MTAIVTTTASMSPMHRNQHQIRAQFLQSLGIVRDMPPASTTSSQQQEVKETQPQHYHETTSTSLNCIADDIVSAPSQQVSFCEQVSVQIIPSYRDYSHEERLALYQSQQEVAILKERNSLEYAWEKKDWRQCLEEDAFIQLANGQLLHPATYQHQQRLKRQKQLRKKQKHQYAYKSVAACLQFAPPKKVKSSRRNRKSKAKVVTSSRQPRGLPLQ